MPINKTASHSAALWICAIIFLGWSGILLYKYYHFAYFGWDHPLYSQLMWSLCHGSIKPSLFGGNFLLDHANYIAFILAPLYFFFQNAITLLYLKLIAFVAGAFVLYLITQKKLGRLWGILFMLGYAFFPANMAMLFFEFNFQNLASFFILLAFYFLEEKRFRPFIITCFFLSLIKENMPLVVFMFGLYGLLKYRKTAKDILRWMLPLVLLGVAIFLIVMFVVQPWLRQDLPIKNSVYWGQYHALGETPADIIKTLVLSPFKIIPLLLVKEKLIFVAETFGPLLLPALLSPWTLCLGLPLFLQNLLSDFYGQQSIFYYYASTLTVFVFLATIQFLSDIDQKQRQRMMIFLMLAVVFYNICYNRTWKSQIPRMDPAANAVQHYALSRIPPQAGVVSSYLFLNFLSQRKDLYVLGQTRSFTTYKDRPLPDSVNYAIADFSAPIIDEKNAIKALLLDKKWTVDTAIEEVVLLRKNMPQGRTLIAASPVSLAPAYTKPVIRMNPYIELEFVAIPDRITPQTRLLKTTYYWNILRNQKRAGRITLQIQQGKKIWFNKSRNIFYGLPLQKGEYLKDPFNYAIPSLPPGIYEIQINIFRLDPPEFSMPYFKTMEVQ